MIIYVVKEDFKDNAVIGVINVEEKAKTYRIIDCDISLYKSIINKDSLDKFYKSEVFSLDRQRAIDIYKKGLNDRLEYEIATHIIQKDKLLKKIESSKDLT